MTQFFKLITPFLLNTELTQLNTFMLLFVPPWLATLYSGSLKRFFTQKETLSVIVCASHLTKVCQKSLWFLIKAIIITIHCMINAASTCAFHTKTCYM